jgi:hypothetical protein
MTMEGRERRERQGPSDDALRAASAIFILGSPLVSDDEVAGSGVLPQPSDEHWIPDDAGWAAEADPVAASAEPVDVDALWGEDGNGDGNGGAERAGQRGRRVLVARRRRRWKFRS